MRNTLDPQAQQLAQQIVAWARQLASVQQSPNNMQETIDRFVELTNLERAEVHRLRPFRVIESHEETDLND